MEPLRWFHGAVEAHGLRIAPLTPEVLAAANELPWHHRDPADRFIIATARLEGLGIVSADTRFKAYGVRVFI